MNQILGIRMFVPKEGPDKGKEKKYDAFYERGWKAESIFDILKNPSKYADMIPFEDRWNIFYTIANAGPGKREFTSQDVIPFDLDGIDVSNREKYIEVVLDELHLKKEQTGVVFSGNGLHILIGLQKPITDKEFFKKNRHHYKAILSRLNARLIKEGLRGCADAAVFDHRRIFRLPLTKNIKPNKPEVLCEVLQPNIEKINFDITVLSGLPVIKESDEVPKALMKRYQKIDESAVLEGCEFIKHCKEKPNSVNEPQWYILLSILGRFENGEKICHEYSEGHSHYSYEETSLKINQALEASGPRTCENICHFWNGCPSCKHFKKVTSPILITGPNTIKTELTGFHTISYKSNGDIKYTPNYQDLMKAFERDYHYVNLGGSRMVYIWKENRFTLFSNAEIENYAQQKFNPPANNNMVSEFRNLIQRTNIKHGSWFVDTTHKKLNFKNGVYDLDKKVLLPHSHEYGFRYIFPYDYDEKATCPVYDDMMKKLTGNNQDIENLLDEFMGYALSNDRCWVQKAPVLVGEGSNGKSTWLNVLKSLVHEDTWSALTIKCLSSEYNRQTLDGKFFNIAEETPTHALVENSLFKTLIAGGEVQARAPYKEPYFLRNRAKFLFSCNSLPKALDNSHGFYRRLTLIPFEQTFAKTDKDYDPFIEEKLLLERSAIFNRAMAGYARLQKQRGFSEVGKCQEVLEDYVLENDTVKSWVCECIGIIPKEKMNGEFAIMGDLYEAYKSATQNDGSKPIEKIKFFKKLARLIPSYQDRVFAKRFKGLSDKDQDQVKKCLRGVKYGVGINLDEQTARVVKPINIQ